MEYFDRVRAIREDSDTKAEVIAKYLKITKQQYSLYETGKRKFPIDKLYQLCIYFHVSADYILGLPDNLPYPKR